MRIPDDLVRQQFPGDDGVVTWVRVAVGAGAMTADAVDRANFTTISSGRRLQEMFTAPHIAPDPQWWSGLDLDRVIEVEDSVGQRRRFPFLRWHGDVLVVDGVEKSWMESLL
jgi:hypothetical protein